MTQQYVDTPQLNTYDQIVLKTKREHRLLSVHWELTYRCNERCTHCYLDVLPPGAQVPGELTTEEAYQLIDQLAELGALTITFSGGELFLRHDAFDICTYARQNGFAIRLFTNGLQLKPAIADRIAALKPVMVELSLYSAEPAVHDTITQVPGSHALTLQAVDRLRERGVRCMVKTPLMRENIHALEAVRALAHAHGASFGYDPNVIPKHTGDLTPLKHRPSDDELLAFYRRHIRVESWEMAPSDDAFRFCGIGLNSLTISPYGDVYTCVGARAYAGNVRRQSLADVWHHAPVWQETRALTLDALPVCATCELQPFCVRCHGTAAFEDGDMLGCSSIAYREARLRRKAYWEDVARNTPLQSDTRYEGGQNEPPNGQPDEGSATRLDATGSAPL